MGTTTPGDIPRKQLNKLIEQANALADLHDNSGARAAGRHSVTGDRVEVRASHPGGGNSARVGHLLDVSHHGVKVIYPGYLHHHTKLEVTFYPKSGPLSIQLSCVWCRHLSGSFHLLGACTKTVIPVEEMFGPYALAEEAVGDLDPDAPLAGSAVAFCEGDLEASIIKMYVADTDISLHTTTSEGELLDAIQRVATDLLIVDLDTDTGSPIDLIQRVRGSGSSAPMIITSHDRSVSNLSQLDPMEHCSFLPKPLEREQFLNAAREALRNVDADLLTDEPIYSLLPNATENRLYLDSILKEARTLSESINASAKKADGPKMLREVRRLEALGVSCGYELLAHACRDIAKSIAKSTSSGVLTVSAKRLESIISRLRSGPDERSEMVA